MRARRTPEQDLEDTRAELSDAREKAARWNARVTELEESVTEKENMLILRAVRSVAASPDELRGLLNMIRCAKPLPDRLETAAQKITPEEKSEAEELIPEKEMSSEESGTEETFFGEEDAQNEE